MVTTDCCCDMVLVQQEVSMNRLREFRESAGLSQRGLAEKAGVSQQSICYMETGAREGKVSTWRKVCDALGVEMSDLLPRLWEKP